jgi:hypothetical protein
MPPDHASLLTRAYLEHHITLFWPRVDDENLNIRSERLQATTRGEKRVCDEKVGVMKLETGRATET